MMKAKISTAGAALAGGIALMAGALGSATGALAQYYPHPHVYGGFFGGPVYLAPPMPRRPVGLGAADIFEELAERGYRPIGVASRRPDVFVIDAIDSRNQQVRLVVDAYDGEILERFARSGEPSRTLPTLPPDPRRREQAKEQAKSPKADTKVAEVPMPPRRPGVANPSSSGPMPALRPSPVAPARSPADWAPINSVPVAPLE